MIFESELEKKTKYANEVLQKYAVLAEDGYQKTVLGAMNYSLLAGGKRLRPILMDETFRMFGGEGSLIEPFMAAIEMIHTYSLVHDDLPAMDNDEYRRGKPTTHIAYGEDMAILAGDALLNLAFETAAGAVAACDAKDMARASKALLILAKKAGVYGMIGGQTFDVESEKKQIFLNEEQLLFIFRLKTGALIQSAMMIGAVLGGASDEELTVISEAAENIGIAFQIQDDLLDVESTQEVLGKAIGSDEKNNKITYVTIKGSQAAHKDVAMYSEKAIRGLASLHHENAFLLLLVKELVTRVK
ncbi:MAG TPA: polyprenyl synthetase family protein [Lachnospiraceae bacterium]|nr:polyprenyl synthetase family protein [Lachnospiraceae bacterium]